MAIQVLEKCLEELVTGERSNIQLDIVYATKDNFMNEILYPYPACFFHPHVKRALLDLADELKKMRLGIKIWDGYRPLHVQKKMWDKIQDERFVGNPYKNGGRHPRGVAVDLTLIDSLGRELEMPTPFDSFEDKAAHAYQDLPKNVLEHRQLLLEMMDQFNFDPIPSEWWHYDFRSWEDEKTYPVLDFTFQEIHS